MGKGILIIASGFVIAATIMALSGQGASMDTRDELSQYENKVIARDAAESGLSQGISTIKRELMGAASSIEGSISGADYDVALESSLYGDFDVQSTGELMGAEHRIDADVIFEVPVDAAALLSSDSIAVTFSSNDIGISGSDHRSPTVTGSTGKPGFLSPIHGIRTNSGYDSQVKSQIQSAGASSNVSGFGGDGSVSGGFEMDFYEALYNEALASSSEPYYDEYFGATTLSMNGSSFGSPGDPKIVVVHGDATLSGSGTGYGLLLVNDGNLTVSSPDSKWEGLVFVRNQGALTVNMEDGGAIHGGLMAFEYDGGTTVEECTPDFDISGDETLVNESFRVRIEVLGAAISMGAGGYDMPVTTQLKIGDQTVEPWGPYDLALDGNVNRSGTFVYEPDEVFPPGSIKVNARSWVKSGGYSYEWERTWWGWRRVQVWTGGDGTENDDWEIHMEKDSESYDNQLEVLEDDSPVPDVTGFAGQTSAAEFVSDYIESGHMKLDKNQSIYLFELGVNDVYSSAHDYQDLVVIVTMVPADVSSCVAAGTSNPRLDLRMGNAAQIQYSAETIAKLGMRLDTIRNRTRVVVAKQHATTN